MKSYSISRGLLVRIVLTLAIASAVTTLIDFGNQFQLAGQLRERDKATIEGNILPVLSHLVWILNEEQVEALAWSLAARPQIARVAITLEDGSVLLDLTSHGHKNRRDHHRVVWQIAYSRDGEALPLGELEVEFASLRETVFGSRTLLWSLLPDLLMLLLVIVILARSVRQRLSEPLRRLKLDIDTIDLTEPVPGWWIGKERQDTNSETRRVRQVIGEAWERVQDQIRERRDSETNLAASVEEKSILLQEIHHRVKNNLQMVVSLLSLQRRSIGNMEAQEALRDSENRVTSMSLVHELLYRADRYTDIDLASYMQDLAGTIVYQTQTGACKVSLDYHMETLFVDLGVAIPLGLIVNELLINAMKHAFTGRETGAISISTTRNPETGRTTVSVCDDGRGLPADWVEARRGSLGLQIIDALCAQIKAELAVASHPGKTCFSIALTLEETPTLEQI